MLARWWGTARAALRGPVLGDATVRAAAALTLLGGAWFAFGPGELQLLGIRALTPMLAALTAIGQWRVGADRRLPASSSRFWLLLSLALLMFTAGMVVDFALGLGAVISGAVNPNDPAANTGETLLYPVAGVLAVVALIVYPTSIRSRPHRAKIGLDVAIVLFGGATFVWYFLGSSRWTPELGWERLAETLVLPALIVVAGFAVLRITLAGAEVICRPTMGCFVFAAAAAASSILLNVSADSGIGRFGSWLQVLALSASVVGMAIQRRAGYAPVPAPRTPGWRRPFSLVPYAALAATVLLLLFGIAPGLDYRGRVATIGVAGLCLAVVVRQYVSLWENARLLATNGQLTARLQHSAYHDSLTGLANGTLFTETVANALARGQGRRRQPPAVLVVDLDDFRLVNDGLGHHIGDEVLVAAADRLRAAVPQAARLGRLGGDEFAVLLENVSESSAMVAAQAIVAALHAPFPVGDARLRVAASVGVATAASTAAELLRNADLAMCAAKRSGGGARRFEPELLRRHRLRAALVRAAGRDEFEALYQPVTDLGSARIVGARVVPRWRCRDAVAGPVELTGDALFALAEETGVAGELDRALLARATRDAAGWAIGLQLRASARRLQQSEFVGDVERALAGGLTADALTFEVGESTVAAAVTGPTPPRLALAGPALAGPDGWGDHGVLERLRDVGRLGVRLVVDGFGTGAASLAPLRTLPIDALVIDAGFVAGLVDGQAPLARAVIAVADELGLRTLASGVATTEQASHLVELGCRRGYGPLAGAPVPAVELERLVAGQADHVPATV